MKQRLVIGMVLLLLCTGCAANPEETKKVNTKIEDDIVERNELRQLDIKSLKEKINHKETFVVMVSQSTCMYCNNMKRSVIPYIREHSDVPLYELEVDMLGTKVSDVEENFSKLSKLITEYSGSTPELIYMKEGKVKRQQGGDMDEFAFHNFLVDCGLVTEGKREAVQEADTVQKSAYLKEISMIECAKKLDDKEDFYLYIAENNRYNAMLSKKLAEYVEKKKLTVFVLNLTTMEEPGSEEEYNKLNKASEKVQEAFTTFQYTPSIFKVKKGKKIDTLIDNVTKEEIGTWFEK